MCISELLRALCARKIHNNYDDMNYSKLIAAIDDRIRANGRREITGQTLHDVLEAMVRSLGAGYQVAGVLGPDDDPGEPDQRFAWLASEAGVYRHCGGVSVTELSWLIWGGGQWLVRAVDVPFGASVREWISDAVAEERSRALIAEALLQKGLDKEVSDRTEAVAAEARERKAADAEEKAAREKAVADERARAEGAEQANAAAIAKEVADRAEAVKAEADARTAADAALGDRIDAETAERKSADAALDGRVTAVEAKIPAQASAENQLADKAFVNSSISTATATFRGTFESLEALKAAEADKNDYAFWVHKDEAGNTCYDKYTYDGAEWRFEYRLNNSSFTAAQWAALNSGVTADVIAALQAADKATAAALAQETADRKEGDKANADAVAAEKTRAQAAEKVNADAIAKETEDRKAADAALQAAIDALPPAAIMLTYDLDAQELFGGTMAEVAAALEKGAEVSVKIQNADAEFASPTSVLRVVGYSYTAPDGPLLLHAVSPRYDAAADVQTNFNSVVFQWTDGGDVALYRFTPQAALVSGTNIKTVNGESLLGSGDLAISGGLPTIKAGEGQYSEIFNWAETYAPEASGERSHAEGYSTKASGNSSHAEGAATKAIGINSHAEGAYSEARGLSSHAEGGSVARGENSHAEGGVNAVALGNYSHAEGRSTQANGEASHAEGDGSVAASYRCHAEGDRTQANAADSHAEGMLTIANYQGGHAEGRFNTGQNNSIHEVGIGTGRERKDGHRITADGKHYIPGIGNFTGVETTQQITSGGIKDLATAISELESAIGGGGPFALTLTLGTGDKWSMDCTFAELAAAVDAKRGVIFTMSGGSYDGDAFTATLLLHSSEANVVVMQGYVNKAYIYVVVTNSTTGLTVDVSEVNLVNINTVIPVAATNENVPGTKAIKDYVDKYTPCVIRVDEFIKPGLSVPYAIKSGELSPNRVIVLEANKSNGLGRYNVFGFQNDGGVKCHGYVVSSTTGEMVQLVFDMPNETLTPSGNI